MGIENFIENAMNNELKNTIVSVLREYFQFSKEENRIYEALIAKITLSFLSYNITNYINHINNEPQTLGELFRDLECQLETLAISMELFIKIIEQLIQSQEIIKRNKDLEQIILMLRVYTKKQLGFMCYFNQP